MRTRITAAGRLSSVNTVDMMSRLRVTARVSPSFVAPAAHASSRASAMACAERTVRTQVVLRGALRERAAQPAHDARVRVADGEHGHDGRERDVDLCDTVGVDGIRLLEAGTHPRLHVMQALLEVTVNETSAVRVRLRFVRRAHAVVLQGRRELL